MVTPAAVLRLVPITKLPPALTVNNPPMLTLPSSTTLPAAVSVRLLVEAEMISVMTPIIPLWVPLEPVLTTTLAVDKAVVSVETPRIELLLVAVTLPPVSVVM